MRTLLKEVVGIDWLDGAAMNCKWKGPRLRDVLLRAGLKEKNPAQSSLHVAFACFQAQCQDDEWYGGSIELWRAMKVDAEVILALEVTISGFPPPFRPLRLLEET
jgi:sulfite oxidase